MIKLLTQDKTDEFISLCKYTVLGSVILTKLFAYGIDSPIQYFWYEESGGRIISVFNLDGRLLSVSGKNSDSAEFYEFIKMLGCKSVYTDFPPGIDGINTKCDDVLILKKNTSDCEADDIDSENIKSIFDVVFENLSPDEKNTVFPEWYTDISLKKRRGLIRIKAVKEENRAVSCAATCSENEKCAVITSVATLSQYRRRGFAGRCVRSLSCELQNEGKSVYLITDNEKINFWYESMGFVHFSYRYNFSI